MAMKKHQAIEAVQRHLAQQLRDGNAKVRFIVSGDTSEPDVPPVIHEPRAPEFEFRGWQFFTITGNFDDELQNDGSDATLRAPDGTLIGLSWNATGKLAHRFDFTATPCPMLYVEIPATVACWADLQRHFEAIAPALETELHAQGTPK